MLVQRRLNISACAPAVRCLTSSFLYRVCRLHFRSTPFMRMFPLVLAHWLPTASRGPHSHSPSHASAVQHVTTCRACGSGALQRPVFSSLDCSVLYWRPIHPGQLEPTTLPLRRLAPVSCFEGLSPTLSLPISLALGRANPQLLKRVWEVVSRFGQFATVGEWNGRGAFGTLEWRSKTSSSIWVYAWGIFGTNRMTKDGG